MKANLNAEELSAFADKIFMYRARHRLNQSEMAQRCGISKGTLCSIEKRQQGPSRKTYSKIVEVLNNDV